MKENTFYFAHDYNARSDVKIKKLLMKYGMQGYGIYWCIVEDLYQNANALHLDYESIAFELRISPDVVESIINDFDLFVSDGINFGSLSVQRRLDERNSKSLKARESAYKRWNKSEGNANAMRMHSDSNAIKESKGKESKVKESKEKKNISSTSVDVASGNFDNSIKSHLNNDVDASEGDVSNQKENATESRKSAKNQKESPQDASEFKKMMELYDSFCKKNEIVIRITASDGKALKEIIAYLKEIPSVKNKEKDIYQTFEFILNNFGNLDKWMQTQTQLRQINSQLPNIINQLKNHYNGRKITNDNQSELQSLISQIKQRME